MISLIKSVTIAAAANSISLGIAAALLDNLTVNFLGYVFAVALFTAFSVALKEGIGGTVNTFVRGYTVAGGLVVTWIALMLTDLLVPAHGFAIEGVGTWISATALLWAAGIAYGEVDKIAPEPPQGFIPFLKN
jgi:hypothetical protein